jgi:hypothetical protein
LQPERLCQHGHSIVDEERLRVAAFSLELSRFDALQAFVKRGEVGKIKFWCARGRNAVSAVEDDVIRQICHHPGRRIEAFCYPEVFLGR